MVCSVGPRRSLDWRVERRWVTRRQESVSRSVSQPPERVWGGKRGKGGPSDVIHVAGDTVHRHTRNGRMLGANRRAAPHPDKVWPAMQHIKAD